MSYKGKVFLFWGVMDLLTLGSYLFFSLMRGEVPFWSDITHFYTGLEQHEAGGGYAILLQGLFFIHLALLLSLPVSAWAFLAHKKMSVLWLALQETMRIFSLTCSLALFPLILHFVSSGPMVNLALFLISETLKVVSLLSTKRKKEEGEKVS